MPALRSNRAMLDQYLGLLLLHKRLVQLRYQPVVGQQTTVPFRAQGLPHRIRIPVHLTLPDARRPDNILLLQHFLGRVGGLL